MWEKIILFLLYFFHCHRCLWQTYKKLVFGWVTHDSLIISNQIDFSVYLTTIMIVSHGLRGWLASGIGCESLFLSEMFPLLLSVVVSMHWAPRYASFLSKGYQCKGIFSQREKNYHGNNLEMTIDVAHSNCTCTHCALSDEWEKKKLFVVFCVKCEWRVRNMDLDIMKRVTGNKFWIIVFSSCTLRYGIEHAVDIQLALLLCVIFMGGGRAKCPTLWWQLFLFLLLYVFLSLVCLTPSHPHRLFYFIFICFCHISTFPPVSQNRTASKTIAFM